MKRNSHIAVALLALSVFARAQSNNTSSPQSGKPSATQGSNTQPDQAPSANSSQSQNTEQTAAASQSTGSGKVQAKTKPEYDAYVSLDQQIESATAQADLASAEVSAKEFETKFPNSDLRSIPYDKLMRKYELANNPEKVLEMGRKAIALDPNSVPAMITVASVLAMHSHSTDLDWQERHAEAVKDTNEAIQLVETGKFAPQLGKLQLDAVKSMAYAAIGTMEFNANNDAAAEPALRKAVELNTADPDPTVWLRLAVTLDHEKKYGDALNVANRAAELSANDPNVHELATQEQTRLKQLTGNRATTAPPPAPSNTSPHE